MKCEEDTMLFTRGNVNPQYSSLPQSEKVFEDVEATRTFLMSPEVTQKYVGGSSQPVALAQQMRSLDYEAEEVSLRVL